MSITLSRYTPVIIPAHRTKPKINKPNVTFSASPPTKHSHLKSFGYKIGNMLSTVVALYSFAFGVSFLGLGALEKANLNNLETQSPEQMVADCQEQAREQAEGNKIFETAFEQNKDTPEFRKECGEQAEKTKQELRKSIPELNNLGASSLALSIFAMLLALKTDELVTEERNKKRNPPLN